MGGGGAGEGPEKPEGSLGGLGRCEESEGLGQDPNRKPGGTVGRDWEVQGGSGTGLLRVAAVPLCHCGGLGSPCGP